MNRFLAANLGCLGTLVAGAVAGAVFVDWPWWAVAPVAFFGGGWVVERTAPGTRLLELLRIDGSRPAP